MGRASAGLAVTVLGHAVVPITSFDAEPGDVLVAAIDMRGSYRPPFDNFCAALDAPPERLRGDLDLLPQLAEAGLVKAGKDISQGGIVGTALMLAECSGVAITIDLGGITPPDGTSLERWLRTFPSFGFLLAAKPGDVDAVIARFAARDLAAAAIGRGEEGSAVSLCRGEEQALFWDWRAEPYLRPTVPETADA